MKDYVRYGLGLWKRHCKRQCRSPGELLSLQGLKKNLRMEQLLKPRAYSSMEKDVWQELGKLPVEINAMNSSPMFPSPAASASHWLNPTGSQGQENPWKWSVEVHLPGRRGRPWDREARVKGNWMGKQKTSNMDKITHSIKDAKNACHSNSQITEKSKLQCFLNTCKWPLTWMRIVCRVLENFYAHTQKHIFMIKIL